MIRMCLVPLLLTSGFLLPGCASSSPQPESLPRFVEIESRERTRSVRDEAGNFTRSKTTHRFWVQLSHIVTIEEISDGRARLSWVNEGGTRVGVAKHFTAAQLAGTTEMESPPAHLTAAAPSE